VKELAAVAKADAHGDELAADVEDEVGMVELDAIAKRRVRPRRTRMHACCRLLEDLCAHLRNV
jgi:hypothetical protein